MSRLVDCARSRWTSSLVLLLGLIYTGGCSTSSSSSLASDQRQQMFVNQVFSAGVTNFTVNVAFEPSASPYVGNLGLTSTPTWNLTLASYQALFQNHPARSYAVPTTLAQMNQLPAQNHSTWTEDDLIALGQQTASAGPDPQHIVVNVIFLNGLYNGDANILGIHFTGYPFAFVFKDVVTSTGGSATAQRYVEQATVVHELGHVVGLVNNGVPMASPHEDTAHPRHATDSACVMYWAVESKSDISSQIASAIGANQQNLFGSATQQDGNSFSP